MHACRIEKWTETVPRLMTMKVEKADESNKENDPLAEVLGGCATFNNERGDDYQEQIGMPDEENMRHWSHHHTTDTVDDPVFRAAMRGLDSVSFVFGLEVTWSLIQQRQQDEEDRLALEAIQEAGEEELENALAANNGDNEENAGDDEASSSDDDENAAAMDVEEAPAQEQDEDGGEGSSTSDESSTPVKSSKDNSNDESSDESSSPVRDDPPTPIENTPEVEIVDTSQSQGDDASVVEAVVASQEPTQDSSRSSQPSPAKDEWECFTCTLFNKKGLRKCSACGTKRPKAGVKRSLDET